MKLSNETGRRWKVSIGFKKEDCWVGVFWRRTGYGDARYEPAREVDLLDVWVCVVPCVPLHIHRYTWRPVK